MASYGLLTALTGFFYSAASKTLSLEPRLEANGTGKPFEAFFSTATGWGTLVIDGSALTIKLAEGTLEIEKLVITLDGKQTSLTPKTTAIKGKVTSIQLA
jgi:hypothetical protein